jgi:hypothetical protein
MYEVEVFNRTNKKTFIKKFNSSERLYDFEMWLSLKFDK